MQGCNVDISTKGANWLNSIFPQIYPGVQNNYRYDNNRFSSREKKPISLLKHQREDYPHNTRGEFVGGFTCVLSPMQMMGFQHMLDLAHSAGMMLTAGLIRTPPNAIIRASTEYGVHAVRNASIMTATMMATLHSALVACPMIFSVALCRDKTTSGVRSVITVYRFVSSVR